jgi:hypothetical protein
MPAITFENAPVLQSLFNSVALEKPRVGRIVRVMRGKHAGKVGVVQRHQLSRFVDPFRYGNELQHHMTQARGRYGYCVRIVETETGEAFYCNADLVMVCVE